MHLSLKGSMDRQPLTDRLGDKLLAEYGGAAAAYSLRALNGNGDKVVRVRRESDNNEKDFTALQISSGEMTNWVNSQIVPPLDIGVETADGRPSVPEGGTSIGTPAAAYSLRSLGEGQADDIVPSGDTVTPAAGAYVVQVRRSSDDNVKSFTADEVADGTLEDWVNTDYEVYSSDFSTTQAWTSPNSELTITSEDGIGGLDDVLELDASTASARFGAYKFNLGLESNEKHSVTFRYYTTDSSYSGKYWNAGDAFSNVNVVTSSANDQIISDGTWREVTLAFNNENSGLRLKVTDTSGGAYGTLNTNLSGSIYIRDVVLTTTHANGYVRTWYDQSTSDNHAVQTTAASQPKIVDAGTYLGEIDFDGVDDGLEFAESAVITNMDDFSSFTVAKSDTTSGTKTALSVSDDSPNASRWYSPILIGGNFTFGYGTSATAVSLGTADTNEHLFSSIAGSTIAEAWKDGTSGGSVSSVTTAPSFVSGINLGGSNDALLWDGSIKEIIMYDSDQSSNRTALEANIGEYYGISGIPAYDNTVDGFVETWYDQSGNGNDATQTVAASQPKIVEGGSLLDDGISFDGDFFLQKTTADSTVSASIFGVQTKGTYSNSTARPIGYQEESTGGTNSLAFALDNTIRFDGDKSTAGSVTIPTSGLFLASTIKVSNTEANNFINGSSNIADSGLTLDDTDVRFTLGFATTTPDYSYDGSIKEAIFYNSDQSANREAIEANINNHYSIY